MPRAGTLVTEIEREHILKNSDRCHACGDEIESLGQRRFTTCSRGDISVDGGRAYRHHG